MKQAARLLILTSVTLFFALGAHSQTFKSEIRGKVSTGENLPLAGAKVVAAHVPSGSLFAAITDKEGSFRLPDLEAGGPYTVAVTLTGYVSFTKESIYLTLGQSLTLDIPMKTLMPKRAKVIRRTSVVVLSMDGFRWDYPKIYHTPNLDRLAKSGCKAESLKPCYPSKTFPNHYAIATGLYPDHNGIVNNSFYDPNLDRTFRMGDRKAVEDSVFWEGEAIWETAEAQGIRTASFYWVGSESNEQYRPETTKRYTSGVPYDQQVDTVFKWLSMAADQRPGLVMFYFDEPDKTSHSFGPLSAETQAVVERLDGVVGYLMSGLSKIEKKSGLDIDLIILSDHGMGMIPEKNQLFLEDIIDLKKIKRISGGNPVINLEPESGALDEVYSKLKSTPHLKVWKRSELPAKYHYGSHPRVAEIVVEADSAWGLELRHKAEGIGQIEGTGKKKQSQVTYNLGTHGYDPENRDMHGIFYAMGPSFKKGYVQPTFENVNIYELLSRLLDVKPAKTDGNLNVVKGMLKED